MAPQGIKNLDNKYKRILSHERSWAYALAESLKKPRVISVWEVLMPVFLIFNYARSRADRDFLAQNFMFTKEMALKAALEMLKKDRARATIMADIEVKTGRLLSSDKNSLYSAAIQRAQLREIELLVDHYCRLLEAHGTNYEALVAGTYPTKQDYLRFLNRLKATEKDVTDAALQTLGSRGDPQFVATVEENAERLRMATADKIFGTSSG